MSEYVEFFFDFGSPAAYLGYTQLPRIAERHGATIAWRPMLLGGVFQATGNRSPADVPSKSRWMNRDLQRWAQRYGTPFRHNPYFPINTLALMRGAVGLQREADNATFLRYVDAIYRAMWVEGRDMADPTVVGSVLDGAGFDPEAFQHLTGDPQIKAALKTLTEDAVNRGVFGAPTFFVEEELIFGQDRLPFVDEALAGSASGDRDSSAPQ